jgi:hypothetical protein
MERGLPTDLGQPQMEGGEGAGFRASMGEISIWGTPPHSGWAQREYSLFENDSCAKAYLWLSFQSDGEKTYAIILSSRMVKSH